MVGTNDENKERSMRHTAVMADSRTESSESNCTRNGKTALPLMQNSGNLALKLVEIFKFFIIHRNYNGGCIKKKSENLKKRGI